MYKIKKKRKQIITNKTLVTKASPQNVIQYKEANNKENIK